MRLRPVVLLAAGLAQTAGTTTISITESSAPPDSQVVLPLALDAPDSVRVGAIDVRLTFPKALLTFVSVEPSGLAVGVDAVVQSDVKPGAKEGESVLHATISTTGSGGSRQPIPTGPLAYVAFRIAKTAKPETVITLTHEVSATTVDDPPKPVAPIAASAAQIGVAKEPVPACFFYMH